VNNAFHDGDFKRFEDADLDAWRQVMEVNFFGSLQLTQAAVPALKQRDDGRIVMVNTMSTQRIRPKFGAYAASKAALATATKTLALELGAHGIRVNGVHPGYIWGDSVEWYLNHQAERRGVPFETVYDEVAGETALNYLPSSAEIAGTVVFLASDLSKPITGQAINVNAGHWFA
jgi:NAD(P)-dependent dehydrogenase (short-subunit alcohol dehydrogenase family)